MIPESQPYIVVFGSAAAFAADRSKPFPRDVDVVYGGRGVSEDDARKAATAWATHHGLSLPLDAKFGGRYGGPRIPVAVDDSQPIFVIWGSDEEPVFAPCSGLSSLIRRWGGNKETFLHALYKKDFSLALGEVVSEKGLLAAFKPSPEPLDFDAYIEGLTALRSAVTHAPAWGEIIQEVGKPYEVKLPFRKVLARLVVEDPRPTNQEFLRYLLACSPAGANAVALDFNNVGMGAWKARARHSEKSFDPQELEALLWPVQ